MTKSFHGKVAIVTGGAQGIGMAVTQAFAAEGAHVFVADLDIEAGKELEEAQRLAGRLVSFVPTDVAQEANILNLIQEASAPRGRIDILVNNAGIGANVELSRQTRDLWDHVLAVNLTGAYLCAKYASEWMVPGGAIINICSTRAFMSEANTEPYSASKGGLRALTHALAVSLAGKRIRVNAISPGWIDVTGWKKVSTPNGALLTEKDHAQHPAGRVGQPTDIAQACLFLCDTEKAGFITGQNLIIDGGMTIKMIYEE